MSTNYWSINPLDLLRTPGKLWIYWKNLEGIYLGCNDLMVEDLKFSSRQDIVGRTDYDLNLSNDEVEIYRSIDKHVLTTGIPQQLVDTATLPHAKLEFLVFKVAMRNSSDEITGVVGFSHYLTEKKSCNSMSNSVINGVLLSQRSVQVLQCIVRGKTVKQTAKELVLSPRTVEDHLTNLKQKFNVFSKSELIDKVFDQLK